MNLIKYFTSKTTYTKCSLSSVVRCFAILIYQCVDNVDKKNHCYKQHVVQEMQFQTWLTNKIKNVNLEQVQDIAVVGSAGWRPFSNSCMSYCVSKSFVCNNISSFK